MNAFYAGALLTLVLSVTMLRIDSSSFSVLPTERPSNHIAADVSFHVVQGRRSSSWDTRSVNAELFSAT